MGLVDDFLDDTASFSPTAGLNQGLGSANPSPQQTPNRAPATPTNGSGTTRSFRHSRSGATRHSKSGANNTGGSNPFRLRPLQSGNRGPPQTSQNGSPTQRPAISPAFLTSTLTGKRNSTVLEDELLLTRHEHECADRKRVKLDNLVDTLAMEYNFSERDRKTLQETANADLHEKMLRIDAHILALKAEIMMSAAERRLHSDDFKKSIGDRLQIVILSPDLSSYVSVLLNHVMVFVQTHRTAWKIPREAFDDPDLHNILKAVIGGRLTAHRSNIKERLDKSISAKQDIYALVHSLKSPHMGVGSDHWSRVAFLRDAFSTHRDLVKAGKAKDNEFWPYVDQRLTLVREKIKSKPLAEQSAHRTSFNNKCLLADLEKYPYRNGASRNKSNGGLLGDLQKTIQKGMVFL